MTKNSTKQLLLIKAPRQIELLVSPVRQEIVDSLAAMGPSTIRQLGEALGMSSDALYFHIRKLVGAGLVKRNGARSTVRRDAAVYSLPAKELRIDFSGAAVRKNIQRVIAAALRSADRDFQAATESEETITQGIRKNLSGGRLKGWLSPADLARVNKLLEEIENVLRSGQRSERRQLCSFTWTLAPIKAMPPRRQGS